MKRCDQLDEIRQVRIARELNVILGVLWEAEVGRQLEVSDVCRVQSLRHLNVTSKRALVDMNAAEEDPPSFRVKLVKVLRNLCQGNRLDVLEVPRSALGDRLQKDFSLRRRRQFSRIHPLHSVVTRSERQDEFGEAFGLDQSSRQEE